MGCNACKIGPEDDHQIFDNKNKTLNYDGLLTSNDKQIWLDNLS